MTGPTDNATPRAGNADPPGAELPLPFLLQRLRDAAARSRSGLFLYPLFWLVLTQHGHYSDAYPVVVLFNAIALVLGAGGRLYIENNLEHAAARDFAAAQRHFRWAAWGYQAYWGVLCAYIFDTAEADSVRWLMLMATVGLTAGACAVMAVDALLARWYPPLLLGPTVVLMLWQGGYSNWALAAVFIVFFFYAQRVVQVVAGDYEGRQRANLLLEERAKEIAAAHDHMRRLASHDDLTGLVNRRHATQLLQYQADLHRRSQAASFSIALLDLDHFKRINDQWGHGVGDEVLHGFAQVASGMLRDRDTLARWGGEEFLLLLPDAPDGLPEAGIERLRAHLEDLRISPTVPALRLGFSAGISRHRAGEPVEQTIDRADRALYQAKAEGRGRSKRG